MIMSIWLSGALGEASGYLLGAGGSGRALMASEIEGERVAAA